jgi:hypothetical protein
MTPFQTLQTLQMSREQALARRNNQTSQNLFMIFDRP